MIQTRFQIRHGIALALLLATVCAGPHGAHAAFDDASDNTCIACHQGLGDERLSQPVGLWSESVHAEVGNTCDGCHGGDPKEPSMDAMSEANGFRAAPEQGEVTGFCGKCHQQIAEHFRTSPHFQIGQPNCINCHGSHTIQRTTGEMVDPERCSMCHDYAPAETLKSLLEGLLSRVRNTRQRIEGIEGFPTHKLEQKLDDTHKKVHHARRVAHTFNLKQITAETGEAKEKLASVTGDIDRLESMTESRKMLGLGAMALFLLLAAVTYFYNEQNKKDEGSEE